MHAFVTGGTGFIGTHLIQELDKAGWQITALVRKTSDVSIIRQCKSISFAYGDITDIQSLRAGMSEGVDAVFHVAGSVEHLPHSMENTRYAINQGGTKNVVDVCLEKKIGRLIYTSTVLTLDFHAHRPLTDASGPNEWCRDQYIHSKRLADIEAQKGLDAGLDIVFMHPSAVFGSQDKATWSKMFLEIQRGLPLPFASPGGGSVCYVRDVAAAHVAAHSKGSKGAHYLLGGPDVTWLEVAQNVAKILNKPAPIAALPTWLFRLYGHAEHFISTRILKREPMLTPHTIMLLPEAIYSDSSKAVRELGYNMSSLNEMLMDCYQWMRETGRLK